MASTGDLDQVGLHAALDAQRLTLGKSWKQVADEVRVAPTTIKALLEGRVSETDGVLSLTRWLGSAPENFVVGQRPQVALQVGPGRLNTQKLYAALDARRAAEGVSWAQAAQAIGRVTPAGLRALAKGGRIHIDLLLRCLGWLHQTSAEFVEAGFEHPAEVARRAARDGA